MTESCGAAHEGEGPCRGGAGGGRQSGYIGSAQKRFGGHCWTNRWVGGWGAVGRADRPLKEGRRWGGEVNPRARLHSCHVHM